MALEKIVKNDVNIPLNYHRIQNIKHIVNKNTEIEVYSYVNEEEREREKERGQSIYHDDIYKSSKVYSLEYNDELTAEDAYDYLKTLDEFKNAKDV